MARAKRNGVRHRPAACLVVVGQVIHHPNHTTPKLRAKVTFITFCGLRILLLFFALLVYM
jgi:hypothetical protein